MLFNNKLPLYIFLKKKYILCDNTLMYTSTNFSYLWLLDSVLVLDIKEKNLFNKKRKRKRRRKIRWVAYSPNQCIKHLKRKKNVLKGFYTIDFKSHIKVTKDLILPLLAYTDNTSPLYFSDVLLSDSNSLVTFHRLFQNYFFSIFHFHFNFKLVNLTSLFSPSLLEYSIVKLRRLTPKNLKIYYFTELSEIILSTFFTKQLCFLTMWYKNLIETRDFKKFSRCRKYLRKILFSFIWKIQRTVMLKGFFVKFKGKFFKGGGKKKKTIFKRGAFSATEKSLRLVYKKFYLRTLSGVVGVTIKLAY